MHTQAAVLLSRNATLPKETLVNLAGSGQAVFTVTCDTCNQRALGEVVGWAREWLPPVQASLNIDCCKSLPSIASEVYILNRWIAVNCAMSCVRQTND